MSKVSSVSGGKAPQVPLQMARAELLQFLIPSSLNRTGREHMTLKGKQTSADYNLL